MNIIARLRSIKESISYLSGQPEAELIFSGVQLADGLSFNIFSHAGVQVPVIFITGYDEYMLMAFENNGTDYVLKPVDTTDLEKALLKYNYC